MSLHETLFLLEIVVFSVHWLLLLAGIFIIVRRYCCRFDFSDHLPSYLAFAVTSAVLFQLFRLAHESNDVHIKDQCPFLFTMFFECDPGVSASFLWRLNVFSVVAALLGDLMRVCAAALGQSAGTFLSNLFGELPWLLYVPSFALCSLIILFSTLALWRYELRLFGCVTLRPTYDNPSEKPPVKCEAPPSRPLSIVKELYQRSTTGFKSFRD